MIFCITSFRSPIVLTHTALIQRVLATFPLLAIGIVASFHASTQCIIGGTNRFWVLLHLASGFSFAAGLFELGNLSEFVGSNENPTSTAELSNPSRGFGVAAALAHAFALLFLLSYLHRRLSLATINESKIVVGASNFLPWTSTDQETHLVAITSWESFGWIGEALKMGLWGLIAVVGVLEAVWGVGSIRGFSRFRPLHVANQALQLIITLALLAKIVVSICMLDMQRRTSSLLGYGCISLALLLGGFIVPAISLHPSLILFTETPLARLFKMIEMLVLLFELAIFNHQLEAQPSGLPRLPSLPPSIKGSALSIDLPSRASLRPVPVTGPSTHLPTTTALRQLNTPSTLNEVQDSTQPRRSSSMTLGWHTRDWVASNLRAAVGGGNCSGGEDRISSTSAETPHSIVEVEFSHIDQEVEEVRPRRNLDEGSHRLGLREMFPPLPPSPSPTPTGTTFPLELANRSSQREEYGRPSAAGPIIPTRSSGGVQEEIEAILAEVQEEIEAMPTAIRCQASSSSATLAEDELTRVYEEMLNNFPLESPEEPSSRSDLPESPQRARAMLQKKPSDRLDPVARSSVVTQASSFVESPLTMSKFPRSPVSEVYSRPTSAPPLDTISPTPSGRSSRVRGGNLNDLFIVPPPLQTTAIAYGGEAPVERVSLELGEGSLSAPRRRVNRDGQGGIDVTFLLVGPASSEEMTNSQVHLPQSSNSPLGPSPVSLSNIHLESSTSDPTRTSYFDSQTDEDPNLDFENDDGPSSLAQIHCASRGYLTVRKASLIRTPSPLGSSQLPLPTIVEPQMTEKSTVSSEGLEIPSMPNRIGARSPSSNSLFFNLGSSRDKATNGFSVREKRSILEAQLMAAAAIKRWSAAKTTPSPPYGDSEIRPKAHGWLPEGILEPPRSAPVPGTKGWVGPLRTPQ
ncbi:BZ3500_MvSof-1268-A1-R1_Chr1-3g02411 [Microbotryum saponariae]|uniref:BZ3500_MvSof-1268-A1-R1_Chr1-3g02411 protein n=1 Tax=Microbotryum saponariae TaxID=289078 RepID=A0A2X0KH50_9BASI|nr:BZ3500_MvSof-1268-A1-R1_Chr1-3g02411 [Microbotryum saponariae]SCZ96198.1 BZ3501_MvSof-1269-A2-R1_Chr1-3g02014 [Microbotryum saponariae]